MKILIITEGSREIGFGHITRCTSIYQAFEDRGEAPVFIVNGDESAKSLFAGKKAEIFDWTKEIGRLESIIEKADIIAVDSYTAGIEFYRKFCSASKTVLFIDDFNRLEYPGGTVLNGTIYAEEIPYKLKNALKYLLGVKYMPLRREFWKTKEPAIKNNIETIMVTFGGDDFGNVTPKVLKFLCAKYPGISKKVVIGGGFRNKAEIKAAADKNTELVENLDASEMAQLMASVELAISAGGQTLYELAAVGVPAISVQVADNQKHNVEGWEKAGFTKHVGNHKDPGLIDNITAAIRFYEGKEERIRSSAIGRAFCDGRGCERVIKIILSDRFRTSLIIRPMVSGDSRKVFDLANDEVVRNWSYSSSKIDWEAHQKWFAGKINDTNCVFFAVEADGNFAGQVRFDIMPEDSSAVIGISIAKEMRGLGLSSFILEKALNEFRKLARPDVETVKAYIKNENTASMKAFEHAEYEFSQEVVVKGRKSKLYIRKLTA